MIFLIDVKGTLDKGLHEEWVALIQEMKQNSHAVCVATSGLFGSKEEQECGFKKEEFSKVYDMAMKGPPLVKQVEKDFNVSAEKICLIDNDENLVMMMLLAQAKALLYESVSATRKQLIEENLLI